MSFYATLGSQYNRTDRRQGAADHSLSSLNNSLALSAGLYSFVFLDAQVSHFILTRYLTSTIPVGEGEETITYPRTFTGFGDPVLGLRLQFLNEYRAPVGLYGKVPYKFPGQDTIHLFGDGRPEVWFEGDLRTRLRSLELESNGFYSIIRNKTHSPFRNSYKAEAGGTFYPVEPLGLGLFFSHNTPSMGYDTLPVRLHTGDYWATLTARDRKGNCSEMYAAIPIQDTGDEVYKRPVLTDAAASTEHLGPDGDNPERVLLNLDAAVRHPLGLNHLQGVQAVAPGGKTYVLKRDSNRAGHFILETEAPGAMPDFLVFTARDRDGRASLPDTQKVGKILHVPKLEVDLRSSPTLIWTPVEQAAKIEVTLMDSRGTTLASGTFTNPYILSFSPEVPLRKGGYTFTLTAYDPDWNLSQVSIPFKIK